MGEVVDVVVAANTSREAAIPNSFFHIIMYKIM